MKMSQKLTEVNQTNNSQYGTYTDYKDSNLDWLGQIPKHWDLERVRSHIDYEKGNNPQTTKTSKDKGFSIPYLSMDYLRGNETSPDFASKNENLVAVQPDDILVLWDGSKAGEFIRGKHGALSSTMAKLFNLSDNNWDYVYYLFKVYEDFIQQNTRGMGIPHVDTKLIKNLSLLVPPKNEQKAIAKFLDRETSKIDRLIEKKEKLIGLLEEKRTALISKTITHGISQDNEMEDSGVTWLRKKPKNWDVLRLRHCCEINPSKSEITSDLLDQKATFLPMENIGFGEILDSSETGIVGELKDGFTYFREGDVLVAKITPCFKNGKGALTKDLKNRIGFGTTELHVLRTNEKIINKFLLYLTNSGFFREVGERMMRGSAGQKRVPSKFIKNFPVFLPPLDKQEYIVKYLEDELSNIDRVVQKNLESIEKLKEYRTALISAAVTGKIDVRGEVE